MPSLHLLIGTAGHVDHGKTRLVEALTGIDCDRLAEEKARGITIDLGFAHLFTPTVDLGFVDVPGHERFLHNALAGMGGIRAMLLVVAADEGVMPQTREHLAICGLLGIREGVVAITKTDRVDDERQAPQQRDVRADGVETIEEYLEVDLDGIGTRVHSYQADAAHRHTSVPHRARHLQPADVLPGVGDHLDHGTAPRPLDEQQRRGDQDGERNYHEQAKAGVVSIGGHRPLASSRLSPAMTA